MNSWKRVWTVSLGKSVEYYDLAVYAAVSAYIGVNFFPETVFGKNSLLLVWLAYGLRYAARPIGGFFIGAYADKYGRKAALVLIAMSTGSATITIACLPTYGSLGLYAPALFFFMQLIQAFFYAGESATAVAYLFEKSNEKEHARIGALVWAAPLLSMIMSFSIVLILKHHLTETEMNTYGWRIPYILGLLNILLSYYFKQKLIESASFTPTKKINIQREVVLKIFLMTIPASILFHSSAVSTSLLVKNFTSNETIQTYLPIGFNVVLFITSCLIAWLIDKYGSCQTVLNRTYAMMIPLGMPVYALQELGTWPAILLSKFCITIFFGVAYSCSASIIFKLTHPENRITTIAVGTNLGVLTFGAFSPLMVAALSELGHAYVGLLLSFGGITYFMANAVEPIRRFLSKQRTITASS
jgi:MHS family proline/betaine transporter-like MFS transporter